MANTNGVGFTAEMRAAKAEKDAADQEKRRAELKGRRKETNAKNQMIRHHPELIDGTNAEQVEVIINRFVKQLIEENRGGGLLDVDYTNKEMVQRRKDQMSVIREHLNLIKQLRDIRELLTDESKEKDRSNLRTIENVTLIEEARELLAGKGIKAIM